MYKDVVSVLFFYTILYEIKILNLFFLFLIRMRIQNICLFLVSTYGSIMYNTNTQILNIKVLPI